MREEKKKKEREAFPHEEKEIYKGLLSSLCEAVYVIIYNIVMMRVESKHFKNVAHGVKYF